MQIHSILHLGKRNRFSSVGEFVCAQTYNHNKFQISFIGELHWNMAQKFIHSFFQFFFIAVPLKMEMERESDGGFEMGELNEI